LFFEFIYPFMIETHAHIYDEVFRDDLDSMLEKAFSLGVEEIWMPNCNHETIHEMLQIEGKYPERCHAMMGLHPCYVDENFENELKIVENWLEKRPFLMIGEIGMDYYWDLTHAEAQEQAFLQQLSLAKKYNLPICIHARNSKDNSKNAIQKCIELIRLFDWTELKGIFHCFSGNLDDARAVIDLGFVLGIGGVATFKNGGLDQVLPFIGIENIVLETDSPYLAPVPHRGKRNEVAFIDLVAEKIGILMNISKNEVITKTTQNARQLINR